MKSREELHNHGKPNKINTTVKKTEVMYNALDINCVDSERSFTLQCKFVMPAIFWACPTPGPRPGGRISADFSFSLKRVSSKYSLNLSARSPNHLVATDCGSFS